MSVDQDQQTGLRRPFDPKRAFSWMGVIFLSLVLIALLWYGGKVLLLVFAGILLAVVLRAPMGILIRRAGLPDKLAYTLVLLALLGLLVGFGMLVGPQVLNQAGEFSDRVPTIIENGRDYLESRPWGRWIVDRLGLGSGEGSGQGAGAAQEGGGPSARSNGTGAAPAGGAEPGQGGADSPDQAEPSQASGTDEFEQPDGSGQTNETASADQAAGQGADAASGTGEGATGSAQQGESSDGGGAAVGSVASQITGITRAITITLSHVALVIVLGLFLAANPGLYRRGLVRLFPASAQQRAGEVVDELGRTLKYWLVGQLALMFITGLLTGIGLLILGIPLALALAFFVFLMEFIPFIGPIIGFIPIVMMAATQGGSTVLWALVLYLAIQQIEGNILTPLIQQRAVSLPPALTVSAVFLGGALFGPIGVILATPLIAVAYVLVKMLYVHDTLGQRVEVPGKTEAA